MTLQSSLYILPNFSRVPLTIVLTPFISTIVNGTLLNFVKRYEDKIRVIFDQWPKLHLGLDALSKQKILKGIYCIIMSYFVFGCWSLLSLLLLDKFTASLQPTESRSLYSCLIDSALSHTGGPGGPVKKGTIYL